MTTYPGTYPSTSARGYGQQPDADPFAGSKSAPALTWPSPGTEYLLHVTDAPTLVQSRDFETGEPATWPDGNPKMTVVINGDVNGEARSLWAPRPSALFGAIADAQRAAGSRIAPGGVLRVRYTHDVPNAKNPRLNPAKQYVAEWTAPGPGSQADPFAKPEQPQVYQPPQAQYAPQQPAQQQMPAWGQQPGQQAYGAPAGQQPPAEPPF